MTRNSWTIEFIFMLWSFQVFTLNFTNLKQRNIISSSAEVKIFCKVTTNYTCTCQVNEAGQKVQCDTPPTVLEVQLDNLSMQLVDIRGPSADAVHHLPDYKSWPIYSLVLPFPTPDIHLFWYHLLLLHIQHLHSTFDTHLCTASTAKSEDFHTPLVIGLTLKL